MDIGAWLRGLGLEQYARAFADNDIDAQTLRDLNGDDLKDIGVVSVGHRKRLLAAIAELSDEGPERAPPTPATASGERRQVTILFADLAGFTELSSALDAEELHAVVSRFFEAVDRVVAHYGGTVDKHMGDAVMALFGAPVAHGDDPLRAVRAAFDIHGAMAGLSAELGRALEVHVGIASGEVVAGGLGSEHRREYTVLGDSVNLAARLDDLAEPGQTLIADAVYRAVAAAVDCAALGEVPVKGLERPVRVWRARGLAAEIGPARRGPLVGRKSELRQFAGVLEACRETGTGQAVLLRGEAGIGKTRLVEEFTALARAQGFSEHKGLVLDFGVGKGQDAIRALVRSLLGLASGGDKAAARAGRGWGAGGGLGRGRPTGVPERSPGPGAADRVALALRRHGQRGPQHRQAGGRGRPDPGGQRARAGAADGRGRALGGALDACASGAHDGGGARLFGGRGDDDAHRGRSPGRRLALDDRG